MALQKRKENRFQATRRQHNTEAAEDYTELIADLIESHGEARTCTIANELGISHVTALRTLKRLQSEGYIQTAPHKPVTLTAQGKKMAKYSKERHEILLDFFSMIGVPKQAAEHDVEGVEHHISPATLSAIKKFMRLSEKES